MASDVVLGRRCGGIGSGRPFRVAGRQPVGFRQGRRGLLDRLELLLGFPHGEVGSPHPMRSASVGSSIGMSLSFVATAIHAAATSMTMPLILNQSSSPTKMANVAKRGLEGV
jgi:hypothetical protein